MSTSFSGLTVENVPSGRPVVELAHVYFPATQTGYKFIYSAYGMITNVSLRRRMTYDSGIGAISDGAESAYVSFNYPAAGASLTDAPAFTQRTQFPAATSGGTAVYSYSTSSGSGTKSFIITRPDSSTLTLTRSDNSGAVNFGLVTQIEIKTSGGTSMAKSVFAYANDPGSSPQIQSIISYDAANQTKVDFDYDQYGNVTNRREYGFQSSAQWLVRRRSHAVYKTDASYVNAYLRSLVTESDVYDAQLDTNDANEVLVAKTTYTYDDYNAMSGMENYGGSASPPGHYSSYDTTVTVRGNMTGRTEYSDVVTPVSVTRQRKIDVFGNTTREQVACCNQKALVHTETNGYAEPEQITTGDSSGPTLTIATAYDYNTSVRISTTDPNNLRTTYVYDGAMRLNQMISPSGANKTTIHIDAQIQATTSENYVENGSPQSISTTTTYDGWGRPVTEVSPSGQVNVAYDTMGRVQSRTNPFTHGGTPGPATAYAYDVLGRVTLVTLPDRQTVQTSYGGNTVTRTDQVNRKVSRVTDGLGRLVIVNEQHAAGPPAQATNYAYNYLGNLTQVNQGGQYRTFKYDSLGRKVFERIPEMSATINDGTGTLWCAKYAYTEFNLVSIKTDSRGVEKHFKYDTENRLIQVWYTGLGGDTSGSVRPALPASVGTTNVSSSMTH